MGDLEKKELEKKEPEKKEEQSQDPNQFMMQVLQKMDTTLSSISENLAGKDKGKTPTPEELMKEFADLADDSTKGKKSSSDDITEDDVDGMSNSQLARFILEQTNQQNNKVIERLEFVRVQNEIRDLKKDYEDFDKFKDEIFKIAYKNPNLSLEDAYYQAKGKKVAKAPKEEKDPKEGKEPSKEKKRFEVSGGEKPGVTSSSLKAGESKTLKDAAAKAVEEAFSAEE